MCMYQIVSSTGKPFGSPMRDSAHVLRMIPASIRPIMIKLGMRLILTDSVEYRAMRAEGLPSLLRPQAE
jgi:hypothetical protein